MLQRTPARVGLLRIPHFAFRNSYNSRSFLRQKGLQFFCQMLTKLVRKHSSVEPVEREIAAVDHFDEGIQDFGLLPDLVAEAEMLAPFDEAQRLQRARHIPQPF